MEVSGTVFVKVPVVENWGCMQGHSTDECTTENAVFVRNVESVSELQAAVDALAETLLQSAEDALSVWTERIRAEERLQEPLSIQERRRLAHGVPGLRRSCTGCGAMYNLWLWTEKPHPPVRYEESWQSSIRVA